MDQKIIRRLFIKVKVTLAIEDYIFVIYYLKNLY